MPLTRLLLTLAVLAVALTLGACEREEPERPIIDPEEQATEAQP